MPPETQTLREIIGEVIQEPVGQTSLSREAEIKSTRVPDEVRSGPDHGGGRANVTPPSQMGRVDGISQLGSTPFSR
jgi:hypothetical protein